MQRKIITTADGSKTIQIEAWNEQYHSIHGAIQEANYVYIKQGLLFYCDNFKQALPETLGILEIGFGTGLNALLTFLKSEKLNIPIQYVGVEAFPMVSEELDQLNYSEELKSDPELFTKLHALPWETRQHLASHFTLTKQQKFFDSISDSNTHDIIYFDAFGARVQPELWTEAIFEIMYKALRPNGILVTYSAKGSVRRALQTIGFSVERIDGPPGKRHMLRAIKS